MHKIAHAVGRLAVRVLLRAALAAGPAVHAYIRSQMNLSRHNEEVGTNEGQTFPATPTPLLAVRLVEEAREPRGGIARHHRARMACLISAFNSNF